MKRVVKAPNLANTAGMLGVALIVALAASPDVAGQPAEPAPPAEAAVPNFWDPSHRREKPNLRDRGPVRFLIEAENPPYAFIGADGLPTGFNVELARAICLELELRCTVRPVRWSLLRTALDRNLGDAIISTMAIDGINAERFAFTNRFLSRPARFVARRDAAIAALDHETLRERTVAVQEGTAHEAYLEAFFPGLAIQAHASAREAGEALMAGKADLLFGDGPNLSLWLNGAASEGCCTFVGGPYTESRYFGEGMAIAVAPDDPRLKAAIDYALARLHQSGVYGEIYLRYFPISFY